MAQAYPAPTKTNLINEKRSLGLALQGYDLLEKKREILVIELLKRMDELGLLEKEIQELTEKSYRHLRKMLLVVGRERALALSSKPVRSITLKTGNVNVSGMNLPTLIVRAGAPELNYSFINSFAVCDETVIEFSELLQKLAAAAGLRSIVWRLAREVKKTQRRVNALDKMVIPRSGEIVKFIESTLDERDRESLFAVKLLKQRMSEQDAL
ncbi:MAG TPA: V-type ATP synthase subunit D [Rectinemataceae bacterium]|nr:V-type ATP synthase subunit D [Rectinemataceae bacterium]